MIRHCPVDGVEWSTPASDQHGCWLCGDRGELLTDPSAPWTWAMVSAHGRDNDDVDAAA